MQLMGLQAIYPKPKTSVPGQPHKMYPYLLRTGQSTAPITSGAQTSRICRSCTASCTWLAVIDWFSRYVLAWQLSNTLDSLFCREALAQSLQQGRPESFNTDQGVQFTALEFTGISKQPASASAWMAAGGRWTMFSWNACGDR